MNHTKAALGILLKHALSSEPAPPLQLRAGVTAEGKCTLSLDGRVVNNGELANAMKTRGSREVHLSGMNMTVPFRCIGPTVAAMQQAGVPVRLGFISEPPAANDPKK